MLGFSSVQLLSPFRLFATPWTAGQASLSITNFRSLLKLMSIESVMPTNHLSLCHPLLLLPSIFPSIRVFSNESAFCISSVQSLSVSDSLRPHEPQHCQASLSITNSQSSPKPMSIQSVMPSSVVPFSSCPQSFPTSGSF